jgi:hypothetical protein
MLKIRRDSIPSFRTLTELRDEPKSVLEDDDFAILTASGLVGLYRYDSTSNESDDGYAYVGTGPGQWIRDGYADKSRDEEVSGSWEFTDKITLKSGSGGGLNFAGYPTSDITFLDGFSNPRINFDVNNSTSLYVSETRIQALEIVRAKDDLTFDAHGASDLPIGTRNPQPTTVSTTHTLVTDDEETALIFNGSTSGTYSLTVDSAAVAGRWVVVANISDGNVSLTEGTATLTWLNGGGSLITGDRTLGIGGIATLYFTATGAALVYGGGIS